MCRVVQEAEVDDSPGFGRSDRFVAIDCHWSQPLN
jgi:hypothetical protein